MRSSSNFVKQDPIKRRRHKSLYPHSSAHYWSLRRILFCDVNTLVRVLSDWLKVDITLNREFLQQLKYSYFKVWRITENNVFPFPKGLKIFETLVNAWIYFRIAAFSWTTTLVTICDFEDGYFFLSIKTLKICEVCFTYHLFYCITVQLQSPLE